MNESSFVYSFWKSVEAVIMMSILLHHGNINNIATIVNEIIK